MDTTVIINSILVIINAGIAFLTWKYKNATEKLVDETKRMADVMERDYQTRTDPILKLTKGSAHHSFPAYRTMIAVENIGDNVIYIRDVNFRVYMAEEKEKQFIKPLIKEEFELVPTGKKEISISLQESDTSKLGVGTTSGRYSWGIHIKASLEMEIAGRDREFKKKTDQVF